MPDGFSCAFSNNRNWRIKQQEIWKILLRPGFLHQVSLEDGTCKHKSHSTCIFSNSFYPQLRCCKKMATEHNRSSRCIPIVECNQKHEVTMSLLLITQRMSNHLGFGATDIPPWAHRQNSCIYCFSRQPKCGDGGDFNRIGPFQFPRSCAEVRAETEGSLLFSLNKSSPNPRLFAGNAGSQPFESEKPLVATLGLLLVPGFYCGRLFLAVNLRAGRRRGAGWLGEGDEVGSTTEDL